MAKDNQVLDPVVTAAVVASLPKSGEGAKTTAVQDAVLELLLKQLAKTQQTEEEVEAQRKASRDYNVGQAKEQREKRQADQESCPHLKPNNAPAIAGQRDHRHNYHWICLYCQKSWKNNELPGNLRVPLDRVGGPQY